ncbi:MAG: FeoB-associated Cys-rich membrane protein [Clostridia bacterium]|nr:FeoB-associated Cys-rich membrane protein [Clostridia bacterium]
MLWITNNLSTILVSALIVFAVVLIIRKMIKDKRSGRSALGCGCGCEGCALSDKCRGNK